MSNDVNDFLLSGGTPSAKFPTIGTLVKGTVESSEVVQQTDIDGNKLTWDDGNPRMQVVITLATDERDPSIDDDDGRRRLFVKNQMQHALREALKSSKAKLEVGGTLAVKYAADKPNEKKGYNAAKQYVAQYQAPTLAAANDLLGTNEPVAAAAGVAADDLLG